MSAEPFTRTARMRPRPATVTRAVVERIATHVREELFGAFIVDGDVEALETLEEEAELYTIGFAREDAERAFDGDGALRASLPLYYSSEGAGELLVVFAYFGLVVHIPHAFDDEEDAFLQVDAATRESDLMRLLRALDALRARDVEAEPNCGLSPSDGFSELIGNGSAGAFFWDQQSHEAFDASGNLTNSLHLQWKGDRALITEVLTSSFAGTHLRVEVPDDQTATFIVFAYRA